jgi:hypothetical protein
LSLAESAKDFVKPPFANYDLVVYFGGGLFALPLINHYFVEPLHYRFPRFDFDIGYRFANDAVSLLSLLFSVYLLGHIIAYCSSIFIEKTLDVFNGKASSAILISSYSRRGNRQEIINSWIFGRFRDAFKSGTRIKNSLRMMFHLPAMPLYVLIDLIDGTEYYRSRVPRHLIYMAKSKFAADGFGQISLKTQWYKTLEAYVIANNNNATSRMYNYLVISGLFRSLSFLFLMCIWAEVIYFLMFVACGGPAPKPLFSDVESFNARLFGFGLLYVAYGFSHSSYTKFKRRYAEEAIFAYVLAK